MPGISTPLPDPGRIIGGMFGLSLPPGEGSRTSASWLRQPHVALANASGCLHLLARHLRPATVWLPSFLCGLMCRALPEQQAFDFHPVDAGLECHDDGWIAGVRPGDLVVFIDYFGFTRWEPLGAQVRKRGAWVVEDGAQAFLKPAISPAADFAMWSPRKFVGVPDGGLLTASASVALPPGTFPPAPDEWWFQAFHASLGRAEFDRQGGARDWFEYFRTAEASCPLDPRAMSELSLRLLRAGFDWAEITRRRRENFAWLARELSEWALFRELPEEGAPLGFPVRLANRDRVRAGLIRQDIFPPVHWPLEGIVPPRFRESHQLAREIMTIPCDQRYNLDDMARLVTALKGAMETFN